MAEDSPAEAPLTGILLVIECFNKSVRPGLAWAFGLSIIAFTVLGIPMSNFFVGIASLVIGVHFNARTAEKADARLQLQQKELVDMAKSLPPENISSPPPPR